MNLDQAKAKLKDISKSTGTKHPKVLVAELCSVVKYLLDKVENLPNRPIIPPRFINRQEHNIADSVELQSEMEAAEILVKKGYST